MVMSAMPQPDQIRLLEERLDRWVEQFPIEAVRQELAALQQQKGSIEAAIRALNARLALWEAARRAADEAGADWHVLVSSEGRASYPTKREAVLALLSEAPHAEWRLRDIRQELVSRGWLSYDRKAAHALEVAATMMAKRGEIHRVRKGIYMFGPRVYCGGEEVAMLTNLRGTE